MPRGDRSNIEVPGVVILRLPIYLRALSLLEQRGTETVNSQVLGDSLKYTPAQIRKDLSYFGKFGKQGRGYNVRRLLGELRRILGLDRPWSMALVGVGRLGRAILGYAGFAPQGFRVVAAFDSDTSQIGKRVANLTVRSLEDMAAIVQQEKIQIGVVAVPPAEAQGAIDALVKAGIKAVLNYAPVAARVPNGVQLREVDPVLALQSMTFYLKNNTSPKR